MKQDKGGHRIERDSMGEVKIPSSARYGAQTARALENFKISGMRFPRPFIKALGLIKAAAASANHEAGLLDDELVAAIAEAAHEVAEGRHDRDFPLDVFQTGSGTSTNMNANEVIAHRASEILKGASRVHPNDHVNMSQSSNDVIPSAIHVSSALEAREVLLPGLNALREALAARSVELKDTVKTGRTHLMDALPLTLGQELGGWSFQIQKRIEAIEGSLKNLHALALGGTAVGTGVNAPAGFGASVAGRLAQSTGIAFYETPDHFASQSSMDAATELSAQLKTTATALMKIADDLRWMNSGPLGGLGEIRLPALQPGSSIMPGKVNPVACECMMMACAQVMGNDLALSIGNERGSFQLNVMLPIIARNLLESIALMGNASLTLARLAVSGFSVNLDHLAERLGRNPILVTALNPIIGYDKAAEIAKRAYAEGRPLRDVALEMTGLKPEELDALLDPRKMT